jgi:hypothetical protein
MYNRKQQLVAWNTIDKNYKLEKIEHNPINSIIQSGSYLPVL